MPLLRIIIPTKNEEKYLPLLLDSIKSQSFKDYEIVVADVKSKDNTVKIAKKYSCKIVRGGMPSVARNNGTLGNKSKILLFFDADCILDNRDFLKRSVGIYQKEKLIAAGFYIKYPYTDNIIKNTYLYLVSRIQKFALWILQNTKKPTMQGAGMMFDAKTFSKIGGFRDVFAEESEILERITRKYKKDKRIFRIIKEAGTIITSERRFENEGYVLYSLNSLKLLYLAFVKGKHVNSNKYFSK